MHLQQLLLYYTSHFNLFSICLWILHYEVVEFCVFDLEWVKGLVATFIESHFSFDTIILFVVESTCEWEFSDGERFFVGEISVSLEGGLLYESNICNAVY